jgi:hypothetical protein
MGQDAVVTTSDAEILARIEQLGRFFMGTSDVQLAMARVVKTLEELDIPYAICGAMAVNAHGLRRATEDVDLLVTAAGLAAFKQAALGRGFVEKFPGSRGVRDAETQVKIDFLLAGGIPGDGVARGFEFPDPAAVAVEIAGLKYVRLSTLIEMKLASAMSAPDRPRDYDDVIRLIRENELGEHFATGLAAYVQSKYTEMWRIAQVPPAMPE